MTFQAFDESDEETRPDQQKTLTKTMTMTKTMTKISREHPQNVILDTFGTFDKSGEDTDKTMTNIFSEHLQRAPTETFDLSKVTFETPITFLTIENNNLNIHSDT